jgi:DNA-binding beta-propeller fold protein YncE
MDDAARRTGGRRRALRTVVGLCLAISCMAVPLVAPGTADAVGELTFDACFGSGAGCVNVAGNPLHHAQSVAVSPNGSVYVTGYGDAPFLGFVSHFFGGTAGRLSYDGCISNDGTGGACAAISSEGGSGTPLVVDDSVAVSPNGRSVYVTSVYGDDLAHFKANATQGQLTWDRCLSKDGSGGACVSPPSQPGTGNQFRGADGVAVSQDASAPNGSVYFVSEFGEALSHVFTDPIDGTMTYDGCLSDDGLLGACGALPPGNPLTYPSAVAVNPAGSAVYVVAGAGAGANEQDTVAQFSTSPPDGGRITSFAGCLNDTGLGGCGKAPSSGIPLGDPLDVAVSPDGGSVYVASAVPGAVSHFFADPAGKRLLSWDGCVSDDGTGAPARRDRRPGRRWRTPWASRSARTANPSMSSRRTRARCRGSAWRLRVS